MDVVLKTSRSLETRIVERPALWMEDSELESLREQLVTIASKTLARGSLTYGVFKVDGSGLRNTVITLIKEKDTGKPVAFNALAIMEIERGGEPVKVIHLGLVMIDPDVQSKGLSWVLYGLTCILLFVRNQLRPLWVSNVTQVPAIVGMVANTFSNVYPVPDKANRRSIQHLLIARSIMADHRHVFGVGPEAKFDEQSFVIEDAYTGGSDDLKKSFAVAQKHRDDTYNTFCEESLDYDRGDDFLQLGAIDLKTARAYLLKSVPRGSILGLGVAGVFVALQRVALPIIYWFDTSRQWNQLRARTNQ